MSGGREERVGHPGAIRSHSVVQQNSRACMYGDSHWAIAAAPTSREENRVKSIAA
jgi:hypothetical protein